MPQSQGSSGRGASLDALPDELLLCILDPLAKDRSTLCRLCLVNHRLHRLSKEILYISPPSPRTPCKVGSFLAAIATNPALANHVKHILWDDCWADSPLEQAQRQVVAKRVRELGTESAIDLAAAFERQGRYPYEDYISVLLSLAPNLERLFWRTDRNSGIINDEFRHAVWEDDSDEDFDEEKARFDRKWWNMLRKAPPHDFQRLRRVQLITGRIVLHYVFPLLLLPSLLDLELNGRVLCDSRHHSPDGYFPAPQSSNVEKFRICGRAAIDSRDLEPLLAVFRRLKFFFHDVDLWTGDLLHTEKEELTLSYPHILAGLLHQRATLEKLYLSHAGTEYIEIGESKKHIHSLRGFSSLKTLTVGWETMFDSQEPLSPDTFARLPENVEDLSFNYKILPCEEAEAKRVMTDLAGLAQCAKERLNKLKRVTFTMNRGKNVAPDSRALKRLFAENGIDLAFRTYC